MRKLFFPALAVALLVGLVGCGIQKGDTVTTFSKGNEAPLMTAPQGGTYALYTTTGVTPIVSYRIGEGDRIGFVKNADDSVDAVAGSNVYHLKSDTLKAYWKLEKE